MIDLFEARRIDAMIGKRHFKEGMVTNDEVKEAVGLTIDELLLAFIFSSRNHFDEELERWKQTGKPIDPVTALKVRPKSYHNQLPAPKEALQTLYKPLKRSRARRTKQNGLRGEI